MGTFRKKLGRGANSDAGELRLFEHLEKKKTLFYVII